jgi:nickel-dependent lactate racemase
VAGHLYRTIGDEEAFLSVADSLSRLDLGGKRVLLIVPDSTRTAPVGLFFKAIFEALDKRASRLDVMIALGTHPPMSEGAICERLEISPKQRATTYSDVRLLNHAWDDPAQLVRLGSIPAAEIRELSGGLFEMDVEVTVNRVAVEYDHLLIVGPVYPHEVVGFSGGSKYLFPGISGPELLNFFHWLGAVITTPKIIGRKWTPVRQVIERAASMVPTPCHAFCLAVREGELVDLPFGTPPEAWSTAADLSAEMHVIRKPHPFHTVLACAPAMYDEMWVGGKCMYKLEPIVADGGELIIYAPHITKFSDTHGRTIERIGYHVRDYFLAQWDRFKDESWGVLAHSTHVRGIGTYGDGVETPRIAVTLATAIPEELCRHVNLGYRDPASIDVAQYVDREDEGILVVPHAGETLYELIDPPSWAR